MIASTTPVTMVFNTMCLKAGLRAWNTFHGRRAV